MRMMARAVMSGAGVAEKVRDGTVGRVMQQIAERWKPEAMYFTSTDGYRSAFIVFDMADPSQMPPFSEPLFALGAQVTMTPVMNSDDLAKGLSALT